MTPMHDFTALGVSAPVRAALEDAGIRAPFPVQELVIPQALSGEDLLVRSPTGSGKTLAFGLALIERLDALCRDERVAAQGNRPDRAKTPGPRALVLAPTRELAAQIAAELEGPAAAAGRAIACCYGGTDIERQARSLTGAAILVATPGRLLDLIGRRMVRLDRIAVLVLDEADRMLDMGFEPQVRRIVAAVPSTRQTLLFSATLGGEVATLAEELTDQARSLRLGDTRAQGAIRHRFRAVEASGRLGALVGELGAEPGMVLVFCATKRGADRLAERLERQGIEAVAMHGDLTQGARERALSRLRAGRARILVATDVAARGIDLEDVAMVVNYDPPTDRETYTHRVGRTARAGRTGTALSLVAPDEAAEFSRHAVALGLSEPWQEAGLPVAAPRVLYSSNRRGVLAAQPARRGSPTPAPGAEAPVRRNRIRRGSVISRSA